MLKQLLINNAESGKPTDYEIRVDDMKVVPRTNDVDQFDSHEEFVSGETGKIVVLIYDGTSRRNTRHTFLLKEEKNQQQNTLDGTEVKKMLSEQLKQQRKEWEHELLEKENAELKKKLEEADEFIGKQGAAIEKLQSGRKLEDMQWGELIGIAGESLLRRNTHLIAKVPGMKGLAGIIEKDNTDAEKQIEIPKPETEASFKMKEEKPKPEKKEPEMNKEDKDRLRFLRQLQEQFSEDELRQVLTLLNTLVDKPQAIEQTTVFAIQWKKQERPEPPAEKTDVKKEETIPEKKVQPETPIAEETKQPENSANEETPEDELNDSNTY
jgi:hypothetical protein